MHIDLNIHTITQPLPLKMGSVNCYLIQTDMGFILVDTCGTNSRQALDEALERAGCQPGDLKLLVITHGDFDHTGNAAYLREKYGAKIAMHAGDAGMLSKGDMFAGRKKPNLLFKIGAALIMRFGKSERTQPDLTVDEGFDLNEFGFDAKVIALPGHSKGSIGILTASDDLFCGDLLENISTPGLGSLIDDSVKTNESYERVLAMVIRTVYPGHGQPFAMSTLKSQL